MSAGRDERGVFYSSRSTSDRPKTQINGSGGRLVVGGKREAIIQTTEILPP